MTVYIDNTTSKDIVCTVSNKEYIVSSHRLIPIDVPCDCTIEIKYLQTSRLENKKLNKKVISIGFTLQYEDIFLINDNTIRVCEKNIDCKDSVNTVYEIADCLYKVGNINFKAFGEKELRKEISKKRNKEYLICLVIVPIIEILFELLNIGNLIIRSLLKFILRILDMEVNITTALIALYIIVFIGNVIYQTLDFFVYDKIESEKELRAEFDRNNIAQMISNS